MDVANHNIDSQIAHSGKLPEIAAEIIQNGDAIENPTEEKSSFNLGSEPEKKGTYEAHVSIIKNQIGDLDQVKARLGLSARKICQLLLVDPSAWTRWTRQGGNPPPHIWRALQWYFSLNEKIPGLTPYYFLGKNPQVLKQESEQKIAQFTLEMQTKLSSLLETNEDLQIKVQQLEAATRANRIAAVMLGGASLILAFSLFRILQR